MPEQEFESFLTNLGKHLRLSASQIAAISAELRDHLESRYNELINAGVSRDDAVRRTLDDLGDGRTLARDLGSVRRIVQTRRLTRLIAAGATIAACVLVVSRLMIWRIDAVDQRVASYHKTVVIPSPGVDTAPAMGSGMMGGEATGSMSFVQGAGGRLGGAEGSPMMSFPPGMGPAMGPGGMGQGMVISSPAPKVPLRPVPKTAGAAKREKLELRLDELAGPVSFQEIPLKDAIVSVLQQEPAINLSFAPGLELDGPVTLELSEGVVSLRTLLALLLEQASTGDRLAIIPRDGLLYLTRESDAVTIEVYPVDDLLSRTDAQVAGGEGNNSLSMRFGKPSVGPAGGAGMPVVVPVQMGGMGGGGISAGMPAKTVASHRGRPLVDAVREAVVDEADIASGLPAASVSEVNGLLVVRATPSVHRKVVDLLGKMRQALADQEQETKPDLVPAGTLDPMATPAPRNQ